MIDLQAPSRLVHFALDPAGFAREDTVLEACEFEGVVGVLERKRIARALLQRLDRRVGVPAHEFLVWALRAGEGGVDADRVGDAVEFGREAVWVDGEGGAEGEVPRCGLGEVQQADVEEGGWGCCNAVETGPGSGELDELAAVGVWAVFYFVPGDFKAKVAGLVGEGEDGGVGWLDVGEFVFRVAARV